MQGFVVGLHASSDVNPGKLREITQVLDVVPPLTPELVEAALADLLPQRQTILPERIVELVAREWKTTSEALLGRDR